MTAQPPPERQERQEEPPTNSARTTLIRAVNDPAREGLAEQSPLRSTIHPPLRPRPLAQTRLRLHPSSFILHPSAPSAPPAFTLVELLIVIVIVAVLAGMVMAIMAPINALRDQTRSVNNLRQWGVAMAAYAADNDGFLPRRGQGVQPVVQLTRPQDWFNALPPYLGLPAYGDLAAAGQKPKAGDNSVFVRPGAKDLGGAAFLSYGMNMNLSPWNLTLATKLQQIVHPASTVFMAETNGQYTSTYPSRMGYTCQAPFRGQGDILFLDGHVTSYSAAYLGVNKSDPGRPDISWLTGTASDANAAQY